MKKDLLFLLLTKVLFFAVACQHEDYNSPVIMELQVAPGDTVLMVEPNDTLHFNANTAVNWQVSGGNISTNGIYTAPAGSGIYEIIATRQSDTADSVIRKVIVTPHAPVFKTMQKGGYVLYFRHMISSTGADTFGSLESQWWKSCDSSIARQISPAGRVQGQETGSALKNLNLPVGKLISSEFCRCIQSAAALELQLPMETSSDITYYVYNENNRLDRMIALAASQPLTDSITILMGHSFTTGNPAPELQMGDAALYRQLPGNKVEFVKIIPTADWRALK